MLNNYMKSYEFDEEMERTVNNTPEIRAKEKIFSELLDGLNLDIKTYDSIDDAAIQMMISARELAYKKGFQAGVSLIVGCTAEHNNHNVESGIWRVPEVQQAWDRRAITRNNLVDLLIDKGVNETAAARMVDKVIENVEEFHTMAKKYSNPKASPECINHENTMNELHEIAWLLPLKSLYRLLGCARELMKAQEKLLNE
jgi:hypothetical protein